MTRRLRYPDIIRMMPFKEMARVLHGEQILCLAMINRALLDIQRGTKRQRESAQLWLQSNYNSDTDTGLSFELCVNALGLKRHHIKKMLATHHPFFA